MDKFLFTDGSVGVKEVQSQEELEELLRSSAQPEKARVWLFNSNEWIAVAAWRKLYPPIKRKEIVKETVVTVSTNNIIPAKASAGKRWLKRFLFIPVLAGGALLIFNFTKIKWKKAAPVNSSAERPANVPLMDVDSLINEIEFTRDIPLDRSTKTNLRLRNTWPERIELKLRSDKETSSSGSRFSNIHISIDNTTGFNLDKAVVKLSVWKDNKLNASDTLKFGTIAFDKLTERSLETIYRGDSISVSFESIRGKAFNFCYSASVKNNSGNYNDRWFCRE